MNVCEKFISINGEGSKAGQLAVFIRFAKCKLNCVYCDTKWANEDNVSYTKMTPDEVFNYIKQTNIKNVTLTGGEPLLQENIKELLFLLKRQKDICTEIETNGSVFIKDFCGGDIRPETFTLDYKLPDSGMEDKMCLKNYDFISKNDCVKFVASSKNDLIKAKEIILKYDLAKKCNVFISPVFGKIEPSEIVDFLKENCLNGVTLSLQLHKIIWDPQMRGV